MLIIALMAVALGAPEVAISGAQLSVKSEPDPALALTITADATRFDLGEGRGWFEGSVRASRGDIRLSADTAEVELGQDIQRATILGTVIVTQGEYRATGTRAVIDGDVLVLTGSPVLESPRHRMVGERMVFRVGAQTVECAACTITVMDGR